MRWRFHFLFFGFLEVLFFFVRAIFSASVAMIFLEARVVVCHLAAAVHWKIPKQIPAVKAFYGSHYGYNNCGSGCVCHRFAFEMPGEGSSQTGLGCHAKSCQNLIPILAIRSAVAWCVHFIKYSLKKNCRKFISPQVVLLRFHESFYCCCCSCCWWSWCSIESGGGGSIQFIHPFIWQVGNISTFPASCFVWNVFCLRAPFFYFLGVL